MWLLLPVKLCRTVELVRRPGCYSMAASVEERQRNVRKLPRKSQPAKNSAQRRDRTRRMGVCCFSDSWILRNGKGSERIATICCRDIAHPRRTVYFRGLLDMSPCGRDARKNGCATGPWRAADRFERARRLLGS